MSKSLAEEYEGVPEVVGVNENENESYFESGTKKTCRCCVLCAFKLLYQFSHHSSAYSELYIAYKYLITLSVTQVECERCFSALRFVKNRLRSTMVHPWPATPGQPPLASHPWPATPGQPPLASHPWPATPNVIKSYFLVKRGAISKNRLDTLVGIYMKVNSQK